MFALEFDAVDFEDIPVSWNASPPRGAPGINAADENGVLYIDDVVVSHSDIAADDFACVCLSGSIIAFGGYSVVRVGVLERIIETLDRVAIFGQVRQFVLVQV